MSRSTGDDTAGSTRVTPDEVMDALEEVLASSSFARNPRSRDFLAFVVTETLAGRGARLKERTVARRALNRPATFDARDDSGVRVQARRVRAALEHYYETEGRDAAVRISIPKGSYVPQFEVGAVTGPDATADRTLGPGVVVVQFTTADGSDMASALALGLTDSLVRELSRFPGIRVVGPVVREGQDGGETGERRLGARLDVQYVLRGTVHALGDAVRVTVRLVDAGTGDVVWSDAFECPAASCLGFAGQDDIVRQIAGFLGDYSGVVLRHAASQSTPSGSPVVWSAIMQYYGALDTNSPEAAAVVAGPLKAALALEPKNPQLLSMLASVESFAAIFLEGAEREEASGRSEEYARATLAIDPGNAHAHLTLATSALTRGRPRLCIEEVHQAIALAPSNPSILYGAGWVLALAGEWESGVAYVRQSTLLNPTHPTIRYALLAVDRLMAGDHAGALVDATRYGGNGDFWGPMLRALALSGLGHASEARDDLVRAQVLEPRLREVVAWWPDLPERARTFLVESLDGVTVAG